MFIKFNELQIIMPVIIPSKRFLKHIYQKKYNKNKNNNFITLFFIKTFDLKDLKSIEYLNEYFNLLTKGDLFDTFYIKRGDKVLDIFDLYKAVNENEKMLEYIKLKKKIMRAKRKIKELEKIEREKFYNEYLLINKIKNDLKKISKRIKILKEREKSNKIIKKDVKNQLLNRLRVLLVSIDKLKNIEIDNEEKSKYIREKIEDIKKRISYIKKKLLS